ncbi:hypothetical protein DMB92_01760 [Campylobacter sp. MIT 99-7217]|uniref:type IIG restriction enzyme/methyltransferase n=1 Tax=Campylobacter sp. MIT 99-7217 TaxID=535091 RepID=UPI001156F6A0|nr:Eco57I restriction-modification methylase domain-containing protein [Campylobacter sp. MIT 99-7217]TQR34710.1 hypothetical protein DMB92_01760 [Campylobacter sp. MIT 99-7217]
MTLLCLNERDFLNPYYYKKALEQKEFHAFCKALKSYKENLTNLQDQNEDSLVANALVPFLKALSFKTNIKFKQSGKSELDLALFKEDCPVNTANIEVFIEAKKADSKEFITQDDIKRKALHESILYYLRLREAGNTSLKFIIITDFYSFYIFEALEFKRLFEESKYYKKLFKAFQDPSSLFKANTDEFYKESEKILNSAQYKADFKFRKNDLFVEPTIKALFIDFKPLFKKDIQKELLTRPQALKPYFKVFHKDFLFDEFNPNDANVLNLNFYNELLYILGLCESKEKGKIIIKESKESKERQGTLFYNISSNLSPVNKDFENAMSLIILWLNRILFLKLIETNLVRFNKDESLKFLNTQKIKDFDDLNELFFEILAKDYESRNKASIFAYLPYLNSSLFEKQECEKNLLEISSLKNKLSLNYYEKTNLKDKNLKAKSGKVDFLEYLFDFLDSFDYGFTDEKELFAHKELISSSVLGLVFEKLNGYKDGSFYTPGFITSYMCEQGLQRVVLAKFNEKYKFEAKDLDELDEALYRSLKKSEDKTRLKKEFKELLKGIKICDPAVGSGHFLVSALNAMLEIYSRLNLLERKFSIKAINEELIIKNQNEELVEYQRPSSENETQLIQKELFYLKQSIIENNLFGVDINANSCEITKLRLWIELLKNSFYEDLANLDFHSLKSLPNIDINIKCGNSLVSRFKLDDKFTNNNIKFQVQKYKDLVKDYKNPDQALHKTSKEELRAKIKDIKAVFKLELKNPKETKKLQKAINEHREKFGTFELDDKSLLELISGLNIGVDGVLFEFEKELSEKEQKEAIDSSYKIKAMRAKIDYELSGEKFKDALEWRFEFPEVLDENGNFLGFDLIVANPPYIRQEELKELKPLLKAYKVYKGTSDIYTYFYELGFNLLKDKGILSFITSNKYTRANYGEALREFLLKNTTFLEYTDLNGIKIFDSATVDTSILSLLKQKAKKSSFKYLAPNLQALQNCEFKLGALKEFKLLEQTSLSKQGFIFSTNDIAKLKAKIERLGTPLKQWDISINYGIKTGYNEAFIIDTAKKEQILSSCDDSEASLIAGLSERKRTSKLIKPILRGRDIKRYSYEWAGLWIIGTFPALKLDIEDYPALKNYLASFGKRLEQSGEKNVDNEGNNARKKTSNKWFETQDNIAYYKDFAREKLVYPNMAKEFVAVLDKEGFFTNQKCFILTQNEINQDRLLYLSAMLNSKLNFWYFKQIGATLGASGYEMSKIFVERLPIIQNIQKPMLENIEKLASEILELKRKDAKTETRELERKLDDLVYKLYDLNEEERALIEESFTERERERERELKFLIVFIIKYQAFFLLKIYKALFMRVRSSILA